VANLPFLSVCPIQASFPSEEDSRTCANRRARLRKITPPIILSPPIVACRSPGSGQRAATLREAAKITLRVPVHFFNLPPVHPPFTPGWITHQVPDPFSRCLRKGPISPDALRNTIFHSPARAPYCPTNFSNSSSPITATPNSFALSNFDPASLPATT